MHKDSSIEQDTGVKVTILLVVNRDVDVDEAYGRLVI